MMQPAHHLTAHSFPPPYPYFHVPHPPKPLLSLPPPLFIFHETQTTCNPRLTHGHHMAILQLPCSLWFTRGSLMATILPSHSAYVTMHGHPPKPFSKPTKFNFLSFYFQSFQNFENFGFNFFKFPFSKFPKFWT